MLRLLALDLGTMTGWAAIPNTGALIYGRQTFATSRYEGGGMRFLAFDRWLSQMLAGGCEALVFEEVRAHRGVHAAHVYGGMLAILTARCERERVPYRGIPVATAKRGATGRGNASKADVIAGVRDLLNVDTDDDNEADALALLVVGCDQLSVPLPAMRGAT